MRRWLSRDPSSAQSSGTVSATLFSTRSMPLGAGRALIERVARESQRRLSTGQPMRWLGRAGWNHRPVMGDAVDCKPDSLGRRSNSRRRFHCLCPGCGGGDQRRSNQGDRQGPRARQAFVWHRRGRNDFDLLEPGCHAHHHAGPRRGAVIGRAVPRNDQLTLIWSVDRRNHHQDQRRRST